MQRFMYGLWIATVLGTMTTMATWADEQNIGIDKQDNKAKR